MKKSSGFLAILALVLVFGFTLVGCDESTPKTIEGLFNELKGFSAGNLWANNGTVSMRWCYQDQRWEGTDADGGWRSHDVPAPFALADARRLSGSGAWEQEGAYTGIARDIIKKLDSFYKGLTKGTATYQAYTASAGTTFVVWYSFYMQKDGTAGYGSSPVESQAPFTAYYYTY